MDPRVTELHCIMPMANVTSVMEHGILSHERAGKLKHHSIALQPIQDRRDKTQVPGGLKLHQYANLYFHARNPMMYKRLSEADSICVLRVTTKVLKIEGTVITDQNAAASEYVRFLGPHQWRELSFDDIFSKDWRHPGDAIAYYRHKARMCAEVLVPNRVEPKFIDGIYVVDSAAAKRLAALGCEADISVNRVLFFR
jgi:hypothetical protein